MDHVRQLVDAEGAAREGYTGNGIVAAVLDSGLFPHPDVKDRILGFADFVGKRRGLYDDYGHGTHVSGILGGNGKLSKGVYRGIAPACILLPVKVLDFRGNGRSEDVIRAIEWVVKNKERYGIKLMNISVGALKKEEKRLSDAVEYAWDRGIIVVAAAGNMGPAQGSVTSPGSNRKVITVGACDDFSRKNLENGIRQGYSGRGPTSQCVVKPELLAPGSGICSLNSRFSNTGQPYVYKSGTSMATPVVSGAAALLLQKEPGLTNVEVKIRLKETADTSKEGKGKSWGRVNVKRLLAGEKKFS